ncbi:MAG: ABC transporter substrate-binding protein [Lachnospiraceae bacterium]|nr:ABC transporter substrate-binding protein [Lachnospiraceae bacterium]
MKKKKVLSVVLAGALTVSSAIGMMACGNSNSKAASNSAASSTSTSAAGSKAAGDGTYTIGICQLVQHDALDAATAGFKEAVEKGLGAESVTFDEQNAAGDSATCATIVNQFVSDGDDLIMANATPALQAAVSATAEIPIVATSVTDYATALDISDWTGKTGVNVTGTADLAPLEDQANMLKELVPDAKTVGILYCSAEANSKYQAETIEGYLDKMGLTYKEYTCADTNDVSPVVQTACAESDVLYIPTDNTMASSAELVNNIAEPAGIPIIAGEEGICKGCGIGTLSISYHDIGYKAGEMAVKILKDGENPADMDIEFAADLTKEYVADRCDKLGIKVPSDYTAIEAE